MTTLTQLTWSDLCVSENPAHGWLKETPDSMMALPVPSEAWAEMSELFHVLNALWMERGAAAARYGFAFEWPPASGNRLRAKRMPLSHGEHVFVCRAFRFKPRKFDETGIAAQLAMRLLSPEIRGGIGLFVGRPGAGKTTTACSYIQERARRLGGVTWTIESPVEIELEGRYENGYIHQREVDAPEMLADGIRDMARATPNVMFVGEVLDDHAAEMVTQASKMGFLVLCTYHGGDLINGIERFARAAGRGEVSTQFVEAFRFAVHLDLKLAENANLRGNPTSFDSFMTTLQSGQSSQASGDSFISTLQTGTPPRVLQTRSLFCMRDDDPLRSLMKNGDFGQLASEIERQKHALMKAQPGMMSPVRPK